MKLFTIEEANALLPTVRQIVAKIQRLHASILGSQEAARNAASGAQFGGGGMAGGTKYVTDLTLLAETVGQLEALDVQLKDFARGLIDFPTMRDGQVVLLCWQLGEGDSLEWWHELETGFAGRKPL